MGKDESRAKRAVCRPLRANMRFRTSALWRFLRNWSLPLAIVAGVLAYMGYSRLPLAAAERHFAATAVGIVQPCLIFSMLLITFCKIEPRRLGPRRWHLPALLFQMGAFAALTAWHAHTADMQWRVVLESAMLCLICPTGTAAAVITTKLGGDAAGLTAYMLLVILTVSLVVPAVVPLIHPSDTLSFTEAFLQIVAKVFPLLIGPLALARLLHRVVPHWHGKIAAQRDLALHLWTATLTLSIAVTTRSILHSRTSLVLLGAIAAASLLACAVQFAAGHVLGKRNGEQVSAEQALGQKNTVFAIWMGYTFLTPATSIAGGFYCIWHNVYNSFQLYRQRRKE